MSKIDVMEFGPKLVADIFCLRQDFVSDKIDLMEFGPNTITFEMISMLKAFTCEAVIKRSYRETQLQ